MIELKHTRVSSVIVSCDTVCLSHLDAEVEEDERHRRLADAVVLAEVLLHRRLRRRVAVMR